MNLSQLVTSDKPVVVQFHAPWCGPCKALGPVVNAVEQEFTDQVTVVRVDVDAEPDLAREAGVRGVPTLIAFRDGSEIRRHTGRLDKPGVQQFFRAATGAGGPEPTESLWKKIAPIAVGLGLLVLAGQVPALAWTRWVGMAVLFWSMRGMCPSCQTRR